MSLATVHSRAIRHAKDERRAIRQLGNWPFAPIEEFLSLRAGEPLNDSRLAVELDATSRATVVRWRRMGLTEWQADRLATVMGLHPSVLWPDLYAQAATVLEELG